MASISGADSVRRLLGEVEANRRGTGVTATLCEKSLSLLQDSHLQEIMAKNANFSVVKLISAAKTGYEKLFRIRKGSPKLNLILYDPRAKRHCLFTEAKKRKLANPLERDFMGRHR